MRDLFDIRSRGGSHPIRLSDQSLAELVTACDASVVIADAFFRDELNGCAKPVLFVEAVEESKDLVAIAPLVEKLRKVGLTRDGAILAVGGGVVQDIACFIASVYMRGVRWTYLPTTLLAMVDSCIGGKSSINIGDFKNLLGTFYPPEAIVIAPGVVNTLPPEHVAAGRSEAVKICYARSEEAFQDYLGLGPLDDAEELGRLIGLSLSAKKWFVEVDEFDRAERLLLNFGHSFGHALESCSAYAVPHGVAVGVGCLSAIEMSVEREKALADNELVERLRQQFFEILRGVKGLNQALAAVERSAFFHFWDSDKKHGPKVYRPILLGSDARLARATLARDPDACDAIWNAFERARDALAAA